MYMYSDLYSYSTTVTWIASMGPHPLLNAPRSPVVARKRRRPSTMCTSRVNWREVTSWRGTRRYGSQISQKGLYGSGCGLYCSGMGLDESGIKDLSSFFFCQLKCHINVPVWSSMYLCPGSRRVTSRYRNQRTRESWRMRQDGSTTKPSSTNPSPSRWPVDSYIA